MCVGSGLHRKRENLVHEKLNIVSSDGLQILFLVRFQLLIIKGIGVERSKVSEVKVGRDRLVHMHRLIFGLRHDFVFDAMR